MIKRDYGSRYIDVLSALSHAYWVEQLKISDIAIIEQIIKGVLGAESAEDVMRKVRTALAAWMVTFSYLC